jgi:hypothetical protein
MMVLRNHNVYGFGSERSSGRIGPVRRAAGNDACGPLTTEVNRKEGSSAALTVATDWRSLFGLTRIGRWSRAIEWRGSAESSHSGRRGAVGGTRTYAVNLAEVRTGPWAMCRRFVASGFPRAMMRGPLRGAHVSLAPTPVAGRAYRRGLWNQALRADAEAIARREGRWRESEAAAIVVAGSRRARSDAWMAHTARIPRSRRCEARAPTRLSSRRRPWLFSVRLTDCEPRFVGAPPF